MEQETSIIRGIFKKSYFDFKTEDMAQRLSELVRKEVAVRNPKKQVLINDDIMLDAARWMKFRSAEKPVLIIMGGNGTGKTTLAAAMARLYTETPWEEMFYEGKIARIYKPDGRVNSDAMMYSAKKLCKIFTDDPNEFYKTIRRDKLVIDELGVEPLKAQCWGNEVMPMYDILCERYDLMAVTILTTNLLIDEINARYGDRIKSRMREVAYVIRMAGQDFRML